jgi:capsular exopolysaccharide synthesis family protein
LELELRQLFGLLRRWWWLLLLLPLVGGAAAYRVADSQQPLYSAETLLYINAAQGTNVLDVNAIRGTQSLAATYQELVGTTTVLEPVVEELGLPFAVRELRDHVSASTVRETQLLRIAVSDTDPIRAAAIANAVAARFTAFIAEQATLLSSDAEAALDAEITAMEQRIEETRGQIRAVEAGGIEPDEQSRLDALQASLARDEQSLRQLLLTRQEMDLNAASAQTRVTVAEPAEVPTAPYAPRVLLYTLLATFAALLIAAAAAALIEYLDNTVKAGADFPSLVGAPSLGVVPLVSKLGSGPKQLFIREDAGSPASEAVRVLRANVGFAAATRPIVSLAISSAGPGEGKSTTAANLAVAMAQAGFSTVLVDADLRRPTQHKIFGVPNQRGLSSLLSRQPGSWLSAAVETRVPDLTLIPSGPLPPNPADLLATERIRALLDDIGKAVDVVVIDTPPILAASDALLIGTKADGIMLVSRDSKTRVEALQRAASVIQQASVWLVGVVVNQHARRRWGEDYYYPSYYASEEPEERGRRFALASLQRQNSADTATEERAVPTSR